MLRILLLDCSDGLERKLKEQCFDVESGTTGYCTGVRKLPSQVYEKDIIIYNPASLPSTIDSTFGVIYQDIEDKTPQFPLQYLKERIENGGTLIVFLNVLHETLKLQQFPYSWIPFMPEMNFTHDKEILRNRFDSYPDWDLKFLAPLMVEELDLPCRLKVTLPHQSQYERESAFRLFWNAHGHCLGGLLDRGRGTVLILPKFKSNESVIDTFLNRIAPKMYETEHKRSLIDYFLSPGEQAHQARLDELGKRAVTIAKEQGAARAQLHSAKREKTNRIRADVTAKQVLTYYEQAQKDDEAALFYLYKAVEAIENKLGSETEGIKALGTSAEWKRLKRLANESYRDARHAPKPTDVIKPWTQAEIKQAFADTETVIMAYFGSLFLASPAE